MIMENIKLKLTTCESGDWEILELNGKRIAENHHMSNWDWINLLKRLKIDIECVCISDEEMEKLY